MRLFYNLNSNAITLALYERDTLAAVQDLPGGQNEPLEVQFHRDGVPELLTASTAITFGVKPLRTDLVPKFEAAPLCEATSWTAATLTTTTGATAEFYRATLSTNTTAILTALNIDSDAGLNDIDSVTGEAQIDIQAPAALLPTKSKRWQVKISNWVNQGGVGATEAAPPLATRVGSLFYFPTVTTYLGGTAALDGVATVSLSVGQLAMFVHSTAGLRFYQLVAGTDAEDGTAFTVIRPDDYNASTNAKVWKSRL